MEKINVLVMAIENEISNLDVIAEVLNLVESNTGGNLDVVKMENIIGFEKINAYGEVPMEIIIFAKGENFELNANGKSKTINIVKETLKDPNLEGIYSDIYENNIHYDIMWVRTMDAIENGIEL